MKNPQEIKNRLESTYFISKEKLNSYFTNQKFDSECFEGKYNIEIFFTIFEKFKEASDKEIEGLIQDNNKLKNQLNSSNTILNIFLEKSEEIINLTSENQNGTHTSNQSTNDDVSVSDRSELKFNNFDQLQENLNTIRDLLFEAHSKLKIKGDLIKKLKKQENKGGLINNIITYRPFIFKKSFFDLLPKWMPDDVINKCMKCDYKFTFCRWKYHCRVCGGIFCTDCSNNYDTYLPFYVNEVRICTICFSGKKYKISTYEIIQPSLKK